MNVREILKKLDESSLNSSEKGLRFEEFCREYLKTDPAYARDVEKVWLWPEFPYNDGHDIGIDLVCLTKDGDYWAGQCKFYNGKSKIRKDDIDSFLSASGRGFEDEDGKLHYYKRRLLFTTTDEWDTNAKKTIVNQNPPVTRIGIKQFEESGIDWDLFGKKSKMELSPKYELKEHQREALDNALAYFAGQDRGKLIMSCGTGKTYTSLRICTDMLGGNGTVLFLAPSISLVSQSLREWLSQSPVPVYPVVICSDPKASRSADEDISTVDLVHPATTNPESILKQYDRIKDREGLKVFFCTYQSIGIIEQVAKESGLVFDIIVADEAHRTTGSKALGKTGSYFLTVHDNLS